MTMFDETRLVKSNDSDLLMLAAKAVGIYGFWSDDMQAILYKDDEHTGQMWSWNPLTNDGDALRLAVKLGLHIVINTHKNHVQDTFVITPSVDLMEIHNDDPYAATRRAIVRAAAEIGKEMK